MSISSKGNIGIGNVIPAYKLDVTGDINFTGDLYQNGSLFSGGGGGSYPILADTTNDVLFVGEDNHTGNLASSVVAYFKNPNFSST